MAGCLSPPTLRTHTPSTGSPDAADKRTVVKGVSGMVSRCWWVIHTFVLVLLVLMMLRFELAGLHFSREVCAILW